MSFTAAEWLSEYEEAKAFAVRLRTHAGPQPPSRQQVQYCMSCSCLINARAVCRGIHAPPRALLTKLCRMER